MTSVVPVAVLGFGYWGANQARNAAIAAGSHLAAIVEPDPERSSRARRIHPDTPVVDSLQAAVGLGVEAAIVATPALTHPSVATECLRSGIHVLVEKPFAMNGAEARALVQLGRDLDLRVMSGHTFLYSAPVRYLRTLIDSGELGDIRYIFSQRCSLGRIRSDCNVLWNLAPHDVSIAAYLIGSNAVSASATGHAYLQSGIADVVFGSLRFASGSVLGIHLSWLDPRKTRSITIVGTEKMAVYDDVQTDRKIEVFDSGIIDPRVGPGEHESMAEWQWKTRAGDVVAKRLDLWEPLRRQIEEFCSWIRGGEEVPSSGPHSVAVTDSIVALSESLSVGGSPIPVGGGA